MSIVYAKSSGLVNAQIGRLETPIKMIIEHESDNLTKQGGVRDWLFNVESSDRFGETVVGQNEFGVFTSVEEGAGAENGRRQREFHLEVHQFVLSVDL